MLRSIGLAFLLYLLVAFHPTASCQSTSAQSSSPPASESAAGRDSDPTRPVFWSFREEFYDLKNGAWRNVFLFRADKVILKERPWGGKRGAILRLDVPLAVTNIGGETQGGLGDIYGQFVLVPVVTRKVVFGAGSGVVVPTATSSTTGAGKFTVAPIAGVLFPVHRRSYFLLKMQDYISVAGDDARADVHYLATTPYLLVLLKKRWWLQLETEAKTNFEASADTSFKSAVAIGRMLNRNMGVWIKPEVPWGPHREGDFTLKTSLFYVK